MIESLIAPVVEWMVTKGSEKIVKMAEFQRTRTAIRQAIARELRLNRAFIDEVLKQKEYDSRFAAEVAEEIDVTAFSQVEESFVPIELFFDGERPEIDPEKADRQMTNWSESLKDEAEWVERIYMRLRILRARWRSGQAPSDKSVLYVKWLIGTWLSVER